jgi:hypothetical protein
MSLSLTPGALYGFANASDLANRRLRPAVTPPPQPQRAAATPETQRARRTEDYVAAVRELKSQQQDMRHSQAAQTYLDIAFFDGGLPLIDVYA